MLLRVRSVTIELRGDYPVDAATVRSTMTRLFRTLRNRRGGLAIESIRIKLRDIKAMGSTIKSASLVEGLPLNGVEVLEIEDHLHDKVGPSFLEHKAPESLGRVHVLGPPLGHALRRDCPVTSLLTESTFADARLRFVEFSLDRRCLCSIAPGKIIKRMTCDGCSTCCIDRYPSVRRALSNIGSSLSYLSIHVDRRDACLFLHIATCAQGLERLFITHCDEDSLPPRRNVLPLSFIVAINANRIYYTGAEDSTYFCQRDLDAARNGATSRLLDVVSLEL